MSQTLKIDGRSLGLDDVEAVARGDVMVEQGDLSVWQLSGNCCADHAVPTMHVQHPGLRINVCPFGKQPCGCDSVLPSAQSRSCPVGHSLPVNINLELMVLVVWRRIQHRSFLYKFSGAI